MITMILEEIEDKDDNDILRGIIRISTTDESINKILVANLESISDEDKLKQAGYCDKDIIEIKKYVTLTSI